MTTIAIAPAATALIAALVGWAAPPSASAQGTPAPSLSGGNNRSNETAATLRLGWPIWIGIVCDDFEAQRRFYRDVLGFKETRHDSGSAWFDLDGKLLELFPKSSHPQYARRSITVGFVVEEIRAARATLLERHVTPVGEIEHGGRESWAYFKDGDGNLFEIVQRR